MARQKNKRHSRPKFNRKQLKPKTEGQIEYIRCIVENDVTFCDGPAGTADARAGLQLFRA